MHKKLQNINDKGYWPLVQNKDKDFCLFTTKDKDGNLRRSGWCDSREEAIADAGCLSGYTPEELNEYAKENNWKIVETIHPSELMGEGFKKGDPVWVKKNAKEWCEKLNLGWRNEMEKMVGNKCEVESRLGNNYHVYTPDKDNYWLFPPQALSPVPVEEEEEKKTIKIEGKEYTLKEIKKALGR